jgi:hypothetical protein
LINGSISEDRDRSETVSGEEDEGSEESAKGRERREIVSRVLFIATERTDRGWEGNGEGEGEGEEEDADGEERMGIEEERSEEVKGET